MPKLKTLLGVLTIGVIVLITIRFKTNLLEIYTNSSDIKKDLSEPTISKLIPKISIVKTIFEKEEDNPAPLKAPTTEKPPHVVSLITATGTILWTNIERGKAGLIPLIPDPKLEEAAKIKAQDLFQKQYFEHISPLGIGASDLASEKGYAFIAIGENLALGNFLDDEELVKAWMNSPGHRANILNSKYRDIGVAVLRGNFEGKNTWVAVQIFGKPEYLCPKPNEEKEKQISNYEKQADELYLVTNTLRQELEISNPQTREEIEIYNEKVRQYNNLIKKYNDLVTTIKILLGEHNDAVKTYNTCINQ